MNNFIRFKLKMLIVLTFCVFMTFSMLIYVMKMTEKCDNTSNEMCIHISKNSVFKATYVFYNIGTNATIMANQIMRPSFSSFEKFQKLFSTEQFMLNTTTTSKQMVFNFSKFGAFSETLNASFKSNNFIGSSNKSFLNNSFQNKEIRSESVKYNFHNGLNKDIVRGIRDSNYLVYEKRRKNLQKICLKHFDVNQIDKMKKIKLNHILIDEKHKILYCYVPKVACTNWKRIFLVLTGKAKNISDVINLPASHVHAKNLFQTLQNYSLSEVLNMVDKYTKFIFVRHPFERLLSAYRNKLEQHYDSSKYFQARFGKYIIKNFRKNPSNVSLAKGDDVTFAEFVDYIISSDPSFYNEHWQRVTDLCHPCLIKYDFIGKYDNLIEDSDFLLKYFGTNFGFPLLAKPSTTALNLKKYYDTLEKSAIFKLYKIYEMDFRLFGYDLFNTPVWLNKSST